MSWLNFIFKGSAPNDKTGTPARQAADIINNNFSFLESKIIEIQSPDGVLKKGNINTDGLNVDVLADAFEWQINQVKFLDNPAYHTVLDAATDGYHRKDVLLGNNTGGYNIFKGEEDPTSASEPNLFPQGTIKLGVIDVFGAVITGSVPVDISGKEDKNNKNQPNGYAGLDSSGKVLRNLLPYDVVDKQINIESSTNVNPNWNGQTIIFKSSCTITVTGTLPDEFSFNAITLEGVSVTWAKVTPYLWRFGTPPVTPEKSYLNFTRIGSTNDIIIGA
ncbi:hypothetical protein [Flavobacterium johnsoniae]|uniref:Uncharacterized protein n=1 Tax=Flavobacterium johnsoniae TaxID=986 RepID=A0A1M5IGH1_FLAJO|nr:hypothetical protein [Flavobacterium johnsoniae]SHG27474.1 hypothetical protein SAMN05444388_10294 [Flavobacterium johnsoniae]